MAVDVIDKPSKPKFKAWSPIMLRKANANWARYEYGRMRGHRDYMERAKYCERMYLGGGLQWLAEDYTALAEVNIKPIEQNQILPKVNAALGYQIANRMDISFVPRNDGADDDKANILSKVIRQIADANKLHWLETGVCGDGFIQERGYYDLRISYDTNMLGEITIEALDPLDVVPDPDAKEYDPNSWADVIVTRWYSLDDIERMYGKEARQAIEEYTGSERDFGDYNTEERRNKFGTNYIGESTDSYDSVLEGIDTRRIRVVDRQYWVRERIKVAVWPTGEVESIEDATPEEMAAYKADGAFFTKRMMKRVRWLVSSNDIVLFDSYSPFPFFTIVPFFPIFRRGITRGIVNNAISPQEMLNKALTSYLHIVNGASNSGWIVEDGSIVNMDEIEFEDRAAQTGLIIKVKPDTKNQPQKIMPNPAPAGIDKFIDRTYTGISDTMGINESMEGQDSDEDMSGIAIQSRQFAAQQKLAVPLDNLARTRHMLAERLLWMVQNFYTAPRLFRITDDNGAGDKSTQDLPVNHPMDDGSVLNDLTIGTYDVVISEQPMHITFDNTQFEQVMKMLEQKIPIPPEWVLKYSNLQEKDQLAKAMKAAAQPPPDPLITAKANLANKQAEAIDTDIQKKIAETVQTNVTAVYSATQAAAQSVAMPNIADVADSILQASGWQTGGQQGVAGPVPDRPTAGPGTPIQSGGGQVPPLDQGLPDPGQPNPGQPDPGQPNPGNVPGQTTLPQNTDPVTPAKPASPATGTDGGIEKPGVQ